MIQRQNRDIQMNVIICDNIFESSTGNQTECHSWMIQQSWFVLRKFQCGGGQMKVVTC